ncbi:hypothetical protein HK104_007532, partial [Borealophlyctis nickersoniae]
MYVSIASNMPLSMTESEYTDFYASFGGDGASPSSPASRGSISPSSYQRKTKLGSGIPVPSDTIFDITAPPSPTQKPQPELAESLDDFAYMVQLGFIVRQ